MCIKVSGEMTFETRKLTLCAVGLREITHISHFVDVDLCFTYTCNYRRLLNTFGDYGPF